MDHDGDDLEAGIISNIPRNLNKKMRKRKHLDALLKFRSPKTRSNDILRSSEDELFLPHQKPSIPKIRSSSYHHCWYYFKRILSFGFVCFIIITCIALIYANIELKNEVENLSSRINEIEKKFSNIEFNNISSMIKQIKTHLDSLEHWNIKDDDSIQIKSETQFTKITDQLNSFRNDLQNMKIYLKQLPQNSTDKLQTEFQSNLDKLRNQINECKCSENILNKPNVLINENQQTKDNAIDVEQIVNRPTPTG